MTTIPDTGRAGTHRGRTRFHDRAVRALRRFAAHPLVDHLIRTADRFSERVAYQFAAAITYSSLVSLVPMVMIGFAIAGFVLSSQPTLLAALKDQVTGVLPGNLAGPVGDLIDQAVNERLAVGLVGLGIAVIAGVNWMSYVRQAVRTLWRPDWADTETYRENIVASYAKDIVALLSLGVAVLVSIGLTTVGASAQSLVVRALRLSEIDWLAPALRGVTLVLAIGANMLIFGWTYVFLPPKAFRARRGPLLIGSFVVAVAFEALKAALTYLVQRVSTSPSGLIFGSVIGLLLFFNLLSRVYLFTAAWLATSTEGGSTARTAAGQGRALGAGGDRPTADVATAPPGDQLAALRRLGLVAAALLLGGWIAGFRFGRAARGRGSGQLRDTGR